MLVCILCFRAIALEHAEILTLASKNDLDAEIATVEFMSRQISQIEEAKKALNDGIAAAFDDFNRVLNTDISIKSNGHSIPGL